MRSAWTDYSINSSFLCRPTPSIPNSAANLLQYLLSPASLLHQFLPPRLPTPSIPLSTVDLLHQIFPPLLVYSIKSSFHCRPTSSIRPFQYHSTPIRIITPSIINSYAHLFQQFYFYCPLTLLTSAD